MPSLRFLLTLFLVNLLSSGLALAQAPEQSSQSIAASEKAFQLRPGVVVAPETGLIYVMSVEPGVEALTFEGETLWASGAAARPLAVYGDLLIAQQHASPVGEIALTYIDRAGDDVGNVGLRLAPGVQAGVVDGPGHQFTASGRVENGVPVIEWQYTPRRTGAMLESITAVPIGEPAEAAAFSVPGEASGPEASASRGVIFLDPVTGRQSQPSGAGFVDPLIVPERPVAGDFIPEALQAHLSADSRHVLVVERVAPGDWEEYRWTIFDASTRERVGAVPSRLGGARFFVQDKTLFFESSPYTRSHEGQHQEHGLELMAVSLESGDLLWAREIRDTEFSGQLPH